MLGSLIEIELLITMKITIDFLHALTAGHLPEEDIKQTKPISYDSWRSIVRVLVLAAIGQAGLSLVILLKFSFIPCLNSKSIILNIGRGVSSFIAISAGSTLGYALHYYKSNYRSLLCHSFYDAPSHYPDEDNLSIGFYMVSTACALLFLAGILNIINIVLLIKTGMVNASKATVNPVP